MPIRRHFVAVNAEGAPKYFSRRLRHRASSHLYDVAPCAREHTFFVGGEELTMTRPAPRAGLFSSGATLVIRRRMPPADAAVRVVAATIAANTMLPLAGTRSRVSLATFFYHVLDLRVDLRARVENAPAKGTLRFRARGA